MLKVSNICKLGDKWMALDEKKVEVLKVWYSVFCTLMDDVDKMETDELIYKLIKLREHMKDESSDLEQLVAQMKN